MAFLRRAALLGLVFAFGCGNDHAVTGEDDGLIDGFDLPPPPDPSLGMRLVTQPVLGLEPGSNHEMCTWTGIKADHDIDVRVVTGYQKIAGHHIIVFATQINMPPGTQRECLDSDMAAWHQIAAAGAEGEASEAPGNLVFRIPAGSYLTLQHHYINASDASVDSQSAIDLMFADPSKTYVPAGAIAILNTDLNLAPGPNTMKIHCELEHDLKAWLTLPHMHNWGTTFNATLTHAGTTTKIVDNLPWEADYAFHPPQTTFDVSAPFMLYQGDAIDVQCDWNNTTTGNLTFGLEMCVFFAQTIDDQGYGNLDCDNGGWGGF